MNTRINQINNLNNFMKRRNFFLTSLLTIPAVSFANFKNKTRAKKGILTRADESRFNGELQTNDTSPQLCKVSSSDTDGDLLMIGPGEKAFNATGGQAALPCIFIFTRMKYFL